MACWGRDVHVQQVADSRTDCVEQNCIIIRLLI